MSLRHGRLFDATVKTVYERALTAAKEHIGSLPVQPPGGRISLPVLTGNWREGPGVKARLARGVCVRAQVQGRAPMPTSASTARTSAQAARTAATVRSSTNVSSGALFCRQSCDPCPLRAARQ